MSADAFFFTGFYTIVLTETSKNLNKTIFDIFSDCWSLYMTNVNLLSLNCDDGNTAVLYTYYPYGEAYCEQVLPVIQDYYVNKSFQLKTEIFPEKVRNFHKCPLVLSAYEDSPHMILTAQPNGSFYTDGIDGIFFRVLSQKLNFTPIVKYASSNLLKKLDKVDYEIPKLARSLEMVGFKVFTFVFCIFFAISLF